MDQDRQRAEVDRNYDAFVRALAGLMANHAGEFALMRGGEAIAFHGKPAEAFRDGMTRFPDGLFSIQEVTDQPIDLGFFSHASA